MVASVRSVAAALLGAVVVSLALAASAHAALDLPCTDDPVNNAHVLCPGSATNCTVTASYALSSSTQPPAAGCVFDFTGRNVIFKGQIDVFTSSFVIIAANSLTLSAQLNARTSADSTVRGGTIDLTTTGTPSSAAITGTTAHPGDIVIAAQPAGRVDVTGSPAGAIRLRASGSIDLESSAPLVANGSQSTADAGSINLTAVGGGVRQAGPVAAKAGTAAGGGSIFYQAATTIDLLQPIDLTGGVNDGGDIVLTAGDDVNIASTIDCSSVNGGNGGSVTARAGADNLGGVKPGGAITVTAKLTLDGDFDVDSGYDGGDVLLTAAGAVTIGGGSVGGVHASGGPPDGGGGTLTIDSSDGSINTLGPLDGDIVVSVPVTLTVNGADSDGGEVDIFAGRDATVSGGVDVTAGSGGSISVIGGRNVTISSTLLANADDPTGDGGSVTLRAGDASFGTLTVGGSVDGHAGSTTGEADDQQYLGCNVHIQQGLTLNSSGSSAFASGRIDLAAPGTISIDANTQLLALPSGSVVLTHAHAPVIGSGVVFAPTVVSTPATTSALYPACPVCGDGVVEPGEACDGAAPGDLCCNASCSGFTCLTPTPTRTATPTRTPTPTATPTLTASPTVTPTSTALTPTPTFTVAPPTPTATVTATRTVTATATPTISATPTPTATATTVLPQIQAKPVLACERALGRASASLVTADVAIIERCGLDAFTCVQTNPAGATRDACLGAARDRCTKKLATLDKARAKFADSLTAGCGGDPPRVPIELLLAPSVLAFEKIDSSCQRDAHLSLNSLGAISACVEFSGACHAENALAVAVPRIGDVLPSLVDVEGLGICVPAPTGDLDGLADAATAKLAVSCQKSTAGAARKLLGQRLTVARNCVDGLLACRLSGKPESSCAKIATRCGTRLSALTTGPSSATGKLAATLTRACGKLPSSALEGVDGLGFANVADRCAALGVSPIGDVPAISTCIAHAYSCAATVITRRALPLVDDILGQFNLTLDDDPFCFDGPTPTPSATPTETPSATVTRTPTATVTASATATATPTRVATASATAVVTPSGTPTSQPTATATPTGVATDVPTTTPGGETPSPTATVAPNPTPTTPAQCGDGIVEPGEQCDFGDTADGDGCSHDCQFELLIPGSGPLSVACVAEWALINPNNDPPLDSDGFPPTLQSCVDGDPSCDADGIVNDECHFHVAICFEGVDARLPKCVGSTSVTSYTLSNPRSTDPDRNPTQAANAAALKAALQTLTPSAPTGRAENVYTFTPPLAFGIPATCTPIVDFVVPLGTGESSHTEKLRATTKPAPSSLNERAKLRLQCVRP